MSRTLLVLTLLTAALIGSNAALIFSGRARAGEATEQLSVSASVVGSCDIGGSSSLKLVRGLLDFGKHRVTEAIAETGSKALSQPVKGSMPLLCSSVRNLPQVSFGFGLHAIGKQRYLEGPAGTLIPYELLRGSSVSQGQWDDNAYPVSVVAGKLGEIPVYGYIPSLPANAKDGLYTDTVTVQLDF